MKSPFAFIAAAPLLPRTRLAAPAAAALRPHNHPSPSRRSCLQAVTPPPPPLSAAGDPVVSVGAIVAVKSGRIVQLARVTGASSSGDTVDLQLLEPFVAELYIASKATPTFERASDVRPIRSEYAPSQEGWIVLDVDLEAARSYFASRTDAMDGSRVVVKAEQPRQLDDAALRRQTFVATKTQALLAAALSLPISAAAYALFAAARNAYTDSPAGDSLLSGSVFRTTVLAVSISASVASLAVGSALLVYALTTAPVTSDADESDPNSGA